MARNIFLICITLLNAFLTLNYIFENNKYFNSELFIDSLWVFVSPIVFFILVIILFVEINYYRDKLKNNYICKLFYSINIILSAFLVFNSFRYIDEMVDGGLF